MATHDYDIANQSGANFRTDLNNCLDAIVSNNSNASEPSTTFAYMWWVDTGNNVLKLRNSANNAWITLPMSITASNTITPTLNMGTGAEEDVKIVFDGNAQDFYIGLDDSADDLIIGKGSTVGTTPAISIDENLKSVFGGTVDVNGNELILDADADTSITADTDDQIDIKIAGSDSYVITGGGDPIFKMQGSGHPQLKLKTTGTTDNTSIDFGDSDSEVIGRVLYNHANDLMTFTVAASTGAQITSAGKFLVNEIGHLTGGTLEIGNGDEKMLFDASGATLQFQQGDAERMRINALGVISNKSANHLVRIEAQSFLTLGDDSSVTLFLGEAGSTLLSVYEGGSGSGALVWLNFSESSGGNFIKSGGTLNFSSSDTDGQICVIKSANSHTATVKNRTGVARNFALAMYGAKIDSSNT